MRKDFYSLYFHIPFCRRRCSYCDFNTYAGLERLLPDYMDAMVSEILSVAREVSERLPVHTIFFGGGTPSLVPIEQFARVLVLVDKNFDLQPGCEISLEANPGTVSADYLKSLCKLGFNRISFGMQSARPQELRLLNRLHTYPDVIQSVKWARQAGFKNMGLDLIFGLPHQTLANWQETVERSLMLQPQHLSLYSLIVEEETPLFSMVSRGLVAVPDDDLAADMLEWADERLAADGFYAYEISNWTREQYFECRHNLQYWRNRPYLGFGAGAHGCASGFRIANIRDIPSYISKCQSISPRGFPFSPAVDEVIVQTLEDQMAETMMVGMRLLREGVDSKIFYQRFGRELNQVYGREIEQLLAIGLVEWNTAPGECLILTQRGRLLGNQVFMKFLP